MRVLEGMFTWSLQWPFGDCHCIRAPIERTTTVFCALSSREEMSTSSSFLRVVACAMMHDPPMSLIAPDKGPSPGCSVHRCECQRFVLGEGSRHNESTVSLSFQCGACGHATMYHTRMAAPASAPCTKAPASTHQRSASQFDLVDALDRASRVEKIVEMKLSKYRHASQRFDLRDTFVGSSAVSSLRDAFKMSLKTLEELSQARLGLPQNDGESSTTQLKDQSMNVMRRFMRICEFAQAEIQRSEAVRGDTTGTLMPLSSPESGMRCPNCEETMEPNGKFCANCGYCSVTAR